MISNFAWCTSNDWKWFDWVRRSQFILKRCNCFSHVFLFYSFHCWLWWPQFFCMINWIPQSSTSEREAEECGMNLLLISSNKCIAVRTVVVCIFTWIHTIRHANAWPATDNENKQSKNINVLVFYEITTVFNRDGYTYKNMQRNSAIRWVRVVASLSTLVWIWAWQCGQSKRVESGPTAGIATVKKMTRKYQLIIWSILKQCKFINICLPKKEKHTAFSLNERKRSLFQIFDSQKHKSFILCITCT